ncbi:MAG: hypothetical protein NTV70_16090 [Acidobacteria bacterium]|nr:hypothetical protein [Acidobacteriota bacterium]
MTIDERLERLTERHQALAESVELFVASTRENFQSTNAGLARVGNMVETLESRLDELAVSTEANFQSTNASLARVGSMVEQLVVAVHQTNESVSMLMTVVESHQRRINDLEDARG